MRRLFGSGEASAVSWMLAGTLSMVTLAFTSKVMVLPVMLCATTPAEWPCTWKTSPSMVTLALTSKAMVVPAELLAMAARSNAVGFGGVLSVLEQMAMGK